MIMQVTRNPFQVSIFFDAADVGYNEAQWDEEKVLAHIKRFVDGFQTIEWVENLHRDCQCGKNPQTEPHTCPARPNEITTCKCCPDCQTKCAESIR